MGPRIQVRNRISGAVYRTTAPEWSLPIWRGETPTITNPSRAMIPVAAKPASHMLSSRLCSRTATATADAISNQIRQNRSALICATGWAGCGAWRCPCF